MIFVQRLKNGGTTCIASSLFSNSLMKNAAVRYFDSIGIFMAKHDIQLRKPEEESIILIDQCKIKIVAHGFGED